MEHLIEPLLLKKYIEERPNLIIVDLRWYISDIEKGKKEWELSHIPGAIFIDLEHDLSDHSLSKQGRHPLPSPELFVKMLTEKGIGKDSFIVAYDDAGGAIASRLWWMMRWINGPETKILNGGFQAWKVLDFPVEKENNLYSVTPVKNPIVPQLQNEMIVTKSNLSKELESKNIILLDARDKERYLGEIEPIDPIAGHIPGAINSPYKENLTKDTIPVFQSPQILLERFETLGINSGEQVVSYCGSGVTACHNILALELAGFFGARLYPGSWSEWCQDMKS